jgi:hypothetical protein
MALDPRSFMKTIETRIGFTADDKVLLKANAAWGSMIASQMSEVFYAYLARDKEMNIILNAKEGRMHRLNETFVEWFGEMFTGMDDWGSAYADRRWRIGLVHVQIGIGPQHVVPAMANVVNEVGKHLKMAGLSENLRDSLGRICMIDLAFIEQAYVEVSLQAVMRETGWSEGLFKRMISTGASSVLS